VVPAALTWFAPESDPSLRSGTEVPPSVSRLAPG
jgi:hypothetical protein